MIVYSEPQLGPESEFSFSSVLPKVGKLNFIGGSEGAFLAIDDNLKSKSTIYTLCGQLGPIVDATVKGRWSTLTTLVPLGYLALA